MGDLVTRQELCVRFGFSLRTITRDLQAMRSNEYFKKYVEKFGHRTVRINLAGYEEYLRFKEKEYKKALWNGIIFFSNFLLYNFYYRQWKYNLL